MKLKVATIVGTRPEVIRLSRVISLLDKTVNHILIHTGQNYDYELNEIFFNELEIRKPNYFLNIDASSVGKAYGNTLISTEEVLQKEKPDAVLVLGDTNSSIAIIIAKRMKIPVYHMEAGNRCFDLNVPEEINRKVVDSISDFNLVYTEHGRRNLLAEGFPARRIYLTGSPMKEVLSYYSPKIEKSTILSTLNIKPRDYFLVSAHREENVDRKSNLKSIIQILETLTLKYKKKVIFSTHPRTRNRLEKLGISDINSNIFFLKPFGFIDFISLQKNALCTISDSGTISEEAAILNFKAITIRNAMERPEAMDSGSIITTGLQPNTILNSIDFLLNNEPNIEFSLPAEYLIKDVSRRVVKLIIGTTLLSNKWDGIEKNNLA